MFLFLGVGLAQESSYQLSSHILDITQGKPAPNVKISLYKQHTDGKWLMVEEKLTDENGRVKDFLKEDGTEHDGIYKPKSVIRISQCSKAVRNPLVFPI